MSTSSDRKAMGETLATYSLMSITQIAAFLGCSYPVAKAMIDDETIPSIPVGKSRKVDPIDLIVHELAGREGISRVEYWVRHGEAVAELARTHYVRIRKLQAGMAA